VAAAGKDTWPTWSYLPANTRPPAWAFDFVGVVKDAQPLVETATGDRAGLRSDAVLAAVADPLRTLGYEVEGGKAATQRIRRPVLFGENGIASVTYEVDAVHDDLGVVVEVEAGRGARGNAAYRDLIRAALILDARYLALMMPLVYRAQSGGRPIAVPAYREARDLLSAVYASQRLRLPFEGVLLVGY
jgi:hypothetical protein